MVTVSGAESFSDASASFLPPLNCCSSSSTTVVVLLGRVGLLLT